MGGDAQVDRRMMSRALRLAVRGEGFVEPNPMVGCVIAHGERIVGEGWHTRFGDAHAEVHALRQAGDAARGATLYVTLEPCCHQGKTPPCTQALLQHGIRRVVAAVADPFPQVAGEGFATLRAARVEVEVGLAAQEAHALMAPYLKRMQTGTPWVIAKWAMTWDGKIATRTGDSRWISGEASRAIVHKLRGRMDAILIGRGTVIADDPLLTARPAGPRTALRIVLDSQASLPLDSQLVRTAAQVPVLIAAAENASAANLQRLQDAGCQLWLGSREPALRLRTLLAELGKRGMTNILVEGGSRLFGSLFDERLIDEVHVFIGARIVGGHSAPSAVAGQGESVLSRACQLGQLSYEIVDGDLYAHGRVSGVG
jgi:diaminohydroxyphosphoribosylaminopyrimidine deaminase/5-amino-6-(5-phosphoribosylamino)uracil reductase